jgi:hypothetical protein
MLEAAKDVRTLFLLVHHSNFVRGLREHLIVPIPSRYTGEGAHKEDPAATVAATMYEQSRGQVMRHGVDIISPSSWEPQEEGMMSTVANFPSVRNQGLIVQ